MMSDCSGERFTLIAENITYKDIIFKIAEKIGAKKPSLEAKPWLLNLAWRLDWTLSAFFGTKRKISKLSALSLQNRDQISNEKIKNYLNYSFQEIDNYLNKIAVYFKK